MKKRSSILFSVAAVVLSAGALLAAERGPVSDGTHLSPAQQMSLALAIAEYWTPERMAEAKPMPIPTRIVDPADQAVPDQYSPPGPPGFSPGWAPASGLPQPDPGTEYVIEPGHPLYAVATGQLAAPQHGTKPTNPLSGPYGPFQRWTWYGRYLTYPTATIGKLFFSLGTSNFVCSATVIQKNTVITAGHCNSDGAGTFATNRMFCPSYNAGGINPTSGCWSVVLSKTSAGWHNNGDPDYDYACLVTATTGTVVNDNIGDFTGWFGRAWNWGPSQATFSFGYPAASPFPGFHIITVAATEWYTHDFDSGDQVSKLMGNDMTGGASGGSWVIGLAHRNSEYVDTDGFSATDPGAFQFPWVNGVNSHKRCLVTCASPPTATNGVFWQEMSSPPFEQDGSDTDDMHDITEVCFANGGT